MPLTEHLEMAAGGDTAVRYVFSPDGGRQCLRASRMLFWLVDKISVAQYTFLTGEVHMLQMSHVFMQF